jgi:hypothetical protein
MHMTKALHLAMTKAAALPEAAQEQLGRELLERLNELRAAIEVGTRELDAGLGEELDIEELIGELAKNDLRDIWRYFVGVASPR